MLVVFLGGRKLEVTSEALERCDIQRPIVGMVTAGLFKVASSAFHCEVMVLICV